MLGYGLTKVYVSLDYAGGAEVDVELVTAGAISEVPRHYPIPARWGPLMAVKL